MPNFEVFVKRAQPIVTQALVTLQRKGIISLNRAAFEAIGEPEAVELLYDRGERIMGLRPVAKTEAHAYPVRKQASSNWLVAGQAFTQFYGIDTAEARRYRATLLDDVLAIDLKQPPIPALTGRWADRAAVQAVT